MNTAARKIERPTFDQPTPVNDVELAFGGSMSALLPVYSELPEEFRYEHDPYTKHVHEWFFKGTDTRKFKVREGIDERAAWRHLKAIMCSFEPKHEHKTAGVAFLMSKWFEPPAK